MTKRLPLALAAACLALTLGPRRAPAQAADPIKLEKDAHVVLMGAGLGSRMTSFGHFETELQLRYPEQHLLVRNMCDEGNTPSFRPHSSRKNQLGFPGAEKFAGAYCDGKIAGGEGHFDTEEQWLARLKPDVLIAFFGYSESFLGTAGLKNFREELDAFLKHTLAQKYNDKAPARLALVSPTAIQDLSATLDVPDGRLQNPLLAAYTSVMEAVAAENGVLFVDAYRASQGWYRDSKAPLTVDGALLNDAGYRMLGTLLADRIFGKTAVKDESKRAAVHAAVLEKDWFWLNDFKIPNGVHAYGRRFNPFGPANYPFEIQKTREMTAIRDQALWAALEGKKLDVAPLDSQTSTLPPVATNFKPKGDGIKFLEPKDALASFKLAPGYKIEQFANEKDFPDLADPVQMSFDNKGRLWVAVMPSYPHWRPGDPRPNDKLLIFEDTNGDGKADKETVFADHLSLPIGFEIAPEGVYVSQLPSLVLLKDTNGDDHADEKEILLSGFDDHDTHHAISAYTADPSGAILMGEGTFLRTNVETPYGTVRGTDGGFYRYQPQRHQLERHAQLPIPNPWGIAYDQWGQHFFLHTSGPDFEWMVPGSIKSRYGSANPRSPDLLEPSQRVRPTSGLEFVSSRAFPADVQGDVLLNNNIGFLGTKQHQIMDDGTGYKTKWRQDLVVSSDPCYRPVDLEFAPDGSLYIIDWYNPLIGHMQHSARDPNRDHSHGRIYRITYPGLPLVKPAKIAGASVAQLLENLKLPEYRTRYRTQRELRGHKPAEVLPAVTKWVASLDSKDPDHERWMLEGLWATWGQDHVDETLLHRLMDAKDYHVRAACVDVIRYNGHRLADQSELLKKAARDPHPRVKLCAIVAATWIGKDFGLAVIAEAEKTAEGDLLKNDRFIKNTYRVAKAYLNNETVEDVTVVKAPEHLKGEDRKLFVKGAEIYGREGFCSTCHQPDGEGLALSGFPPLAKSSWVAQDEERMIKLVLKGVFGPLDLDGKKYPGLVPMTPFGGMLDDEEVASVLTYVRNSFGNAGAPVSAAKVKQVREVTKGRLDFYTPEELLNPNAKPSATARRFVKMWTMEDFKGDFNAPLKKRSFERGKAMFQAAGCISCHNVQGQGGHVGADLSKVGQEYPGSELLHQIIDPSAKIKDDFRVVAVFLKNDDKFRGMIVKREGDTIQLAENLSEPDKTITIKKADISRVTPSDVSPMPTGLLVTLSKEEVLDLLAYLISQGNAKHAVYGD